MIKIRKSEERGRTDLGWLKGRFTFSFAGYDDPEHAGFRSLRVMNEDRFSPGRGFGPHAHRDMEIISYVLEGRLVHRDSTGEQHTMGPNEIQLMSAGTGIVHSEFNASETEALHMMQIWIEPASEDLTPSYQQIAFPPEEKQGRLRLLAGPEASVGQPVAVINQDTRLYVGDLATSECLRHVPRPGRYAWVQVVRGEGTLNGQELRAGDGAACVGEEELSLVGVGSDGAEVLVFDLL